MSTSIRKQSGMSLKLWGEPVLELDLWKVSGENIICKEVGNELPSSSFHISSY